MLKELLEKYLKLFPEDREKLDLLSNQIRRGDKLTGKDNYAGHVTGSPIILSPDLSKLLLIYHPTMEMWMQPGGHWDEDEPGPWETAEREGYEETGVKISKMVALPDKRVPLQIFEAVVPTKPPKNEPEHIHHDFRYLFVAANEELSLEDEVIKDARWFDLRGVKDPALHQIIERARQLKLLKA